MDTKLCEDIETKFTGAHSLLTHLQRDTTQETENEAALRHAWKKALKSAGLGAGDLRINTHNTLFWAQLSLSTHVVHNHEELQHTCTHACHCKIVVMLLLPSTSVDYCRELLGQIKWAERTYSIMMGDTKKECRKHECFNSYRLLTETHQHNVCLKMLIFPANTHKWLNSTLLRPFLQCTNPPIHS